MYDQAFGHSNGACVLLGDPPNALGEMFFFEIDVDLAWIYLFPKFEDVDDANDRTVLGAKTGHLQIVLYSSNKLCLNHFELQLTCASPEHRPPKRNLHLPTID